MGVGLIGIIDRPILAKNAADYFGKKGFSRKPKRREAI